MNIPNPFQEIYARLSNMESLLLDIKHPESSRIDSQPKIILDTDQLMEKLGVTRPTLSKWRKEDRIPFIQVGSVIRYDLDAVLEALSKKKGGKRC